MDLGWANSSWAGLILASSLVFDLRTKKIPNWFLVSALVVSLMIWLSLALYQSVGLRIQDVLNLLSSFALAGVFGFLLWMGKVVGGGDAKLWIALSPVLIWTDMFAWILLSLIWGGLFGLAYVVSKGTLVKFVQNIVFIGSRKPVQSEDLHRMPFTVGILLGYLSLLSLKQIGWGLV